MINGELKNQINTIWDAFWSGGISNPLEVIEQITISVNLVKNISGSISGHGS
jgi:hypothetical protein